MRSPPETSAPRRALPLAVACALVALGAALGFGRGAATPSLLVLREPAALRTTGSMALAAPALLVGSLAGSERSESQAASPLPGVGPVAGPSLPCAPEPLLSRGTRPLLDDATLMRVLRDNPQALGSAALGSATRGSLLGGVALASSDSIVRAGGYPYGTERVVRSIERAVGQVRRCHPDTPPLFVGDISRPRGGHLRPHRSHQNGLDADIGYYLTTEAGWYERATPKNLDRVRTWELVKALVDGANVETIFIDLSLHAALKEQAELAGDAERLALFPSPLKKDTVIRHTWGHATHLHVRFRDPEAEALGARIDRLTLASKRLL